MGPSKCAKRKCKILWQLKQFMQEMRNISAPSTVVAIVDERVFFSPVRLRGPSLQLGPLKSIQKFHQHLRKGIQIKPNPDPEVIGWSTSPTGLGLHLSSYTAILGAWTLWSADMKLLVSVVGRGFQGTLLGIFDGLPRWIRKIIFGGNEIK